MSTYRFPAAGVLMLILAAAMAPAAAGNRAPCEGAMLLSSPEDSDLPPDFTGFGSAVAIWEDTALVGLPGRYTGDPSRPTGRAAIFTCDARTRTWSRTGSLDPGPQGEFESSFGAALVLQDDRAVVGSSNAVHIFDKTRGSRKKSAEWKLVVKLTSNGVDDFIVPIIAYDHPFLALVRTMVRDEQPTRFIEIYRIGKDNKARREARLQPAEDFGAMALDDETLVVGPQVYTRRKDARWFLMQVLQAEPGDDSFGSGGVAIVRRTILVGSPVEGRIVTDEGPIGGGAVYVFELQKRGMWEQTQRLRPDTEAFGFHLFGQTLAFDGAYAAVGAPGALGGFQREHGPTFIYRVSGERLVFDRALNDLIAHSMDLYQSQLIAGTSLTIQGLPIAQAAIVPLLRNPAQ